jgi:hypothetical protein
MGLSIGSFARVSTQEATVMAAHPIKYWSHEQVQYPLYLSILGAYCTYKLETPPTLAAGGLEFQGDYYSTASSLEVEARRLHANAVPTRVERKGLEQRRGGMRVQASKCFAWDTVRWRQSYEWGGQFVNPLLM